MVVFELINHLKIIIVYNIITYVNKKYSGGITMMINKRLINMCKDSKKYIGFTILANWLASICNILIIIIIGKFVSKVYISELSGGEVFKNIYTLKIWAI